MGEKAAQALRSGRKQKRDAGQELVGAESITNSPHHAEEGSKNTCWEKIASLPNGAVTVTNPQVK